VIGQTISHYQITEELGRGGMGVVYKAQDTKLKRTVALKFLSPHLLADPKEKARFLHEAQAAAALDHPNISTIHEVHEADGHTFMVMAFIEGEDIGAKMASGEMALDEALDIAVQVARGLSKAHSSGIVHRAKAHSSGIVHRDIKPGNVIITNEGVAKVVDFGLAKLATQTKLTKTGTTVGTVRYMSPEQATGGEVDHRTDVWSLGVMLYEMLAGSPPFRGDVEPAMVYSILNEDPKPVTETRKGVPVALEDILEKALAKDPAKRFATMEEFLTALETQRDQITLGIKERKFTAIRKLKRRKRLSATIATVLVVGIAVILAQVFYEKSMAIDSVAVLPFANLSGDAEQEYYSDGMTDALINELGQVGALTVISRTSVMQFKNTDKTLPEIAKELNVDAVIEASVMKEGEKVRITAQLIRANPERQMWAESYTRDAGDVLSLHSEVARAITDRIEVAVTAEERERLSRSRKVDPDAYDAYLKGRLSHYTWSVEGFRKAIDYYREAIRIEPSYAPAYARMADTYSEMFLWEAVPWEKAHPKARAAAERALELDPSLGAAHAATGTVKLFFDWDFVGPDADHRRALELNPNNPDTRAAYDFYLTIVGRHEEAIEHSRKGVEVDPLTPQMELHLAWVLYYAGRYDESIEVCKNVLGEGIDAGTYLQLAWAYTAKGMYEESVAALDSAFALTSYLDDMGLLNQGAYYYARSGREDKATEILNRMLELSETQQVGSTLVAFVYSGLGETDKMFEWLEKGYEERTIGCIFLRLNFGEYSDDPRYQDLARRIGFPHDG
jgi:serine/threonine-protein kinase